LTIASPHPFARDVLLFLHVPKAAGSTLQWPLYMEYARGDLPDVADYNLWRGILYYPGPQWGFFKPRQLETPPSVVAALQNHPVGAVLGHFVFGLHRLVKGPSAYITFLREPLSRVSSLYFHLAGATVPNGEPWFLGESDRPFTEATTIEEFVLEHRLRELDNDQTRRIAGVEPEYGACSRSMLDLAKRNIEKRFAAVGLTDRFDESLALAAEVLKWNSDPAYFSRLVNESRVPVSELSSFARDAILERNQLDLELYRFAEHRLQAGIDQLGSRFHERLRALQQASRELFGQAQPA